MKFDFSHVNLEYLIRARDLAERDCELAATLLGIPIEMARLLAELTPQELTYISLIKPPLLTPRQATWWWSRLFTAIRAGRMEELAAIVEHASLITVGEEPL
jgi:hypothetical protein